MQDVKPIHVVILQGCVNLHLSTHGKDLQNFTVQNTKKSINSQTHVTTALHNYVFLTGIHRLLVINS